MERAKYVVVDGKHSKVEPDGSRKEYVPGDEIWLTPEAALAMGRYVTPADKSDDEPQTLDAGPSEDEPARERTHDDHIKDSKDSKKRTTTRKR